MQHCMPVVHRGNGVCVCVCVCGGGGNMFSDGLTYAGAHVRKAFCNPRLPG